MPEQEERPIKSGPISRREFLKVAGMAGAVVGLGGGLGGVLAACGGGETTTTTAAVTTTAAAVTTTAGEATTTTAGTGTTEALAELVDLPPDPENIIPTLPRAVQENFQGYPSEVLPSKWADYAGTPPPWRIGLSGQAPSTAWSQGLYDGVEKAFNEAKAQGLVEGDLMKAILVDQATQTPAQQISGLQAMVRDGCQGVIMLPLAGDALSPSITAAGEQGVPTIITSNLNNSAYAVNVFPPNVRNAIVGTLEVIGNKGNVLIVRGIAGNPVETWGYEEIQRALANRPECTVVGEVLGNWNNATTKTVVTQFLASYSGTVDAVVHCGSMAQGIIQAFEQAGREVPPVSMNGSMAGELAWFADHVDEGYKTVGNAYGGAEEADACFRVLLRILAGKGLLVRDVPLVPPEVTAENVAQFVPEGATLNSAEDPLGDPQVFCPDSFLDLVFKTPGNAGASA